MTGTMAELWLAALFLPASHFAISSTGLRDTLVRRLGETPYRGVFSLIAVAALVWLATAYNNAPAGPELWWLGSIGRHLAVGLMPLALLLLVGGVSAPNPTAVGAEPFLEQEQPVRGVLRITRHPVMWATGLWALLHLAGNGDLPSVIFFSSPAVLALAGTVLIDRKQRRRRPETYARYQAATSNLPFLAIGMGQQSLVTALREMGAIRISAALVLYVALLHGHQWLFGVSPFP